MNQGYEQQFFERMDQAARSSADAVVPLVLELLSPARVIDVGSGHGEWLAAFLARGVADGLAIDGPWVDTESLAVPPEKFRVVSLDESWTVAERFDLAVCLEVAEHIPDRRSSELIGNLVSLAPAVLFSAALPGQEGTHHINEQWPEYWHRRFREKGYVRIDSIRPQIWQDPRVAWYYQQNIYLYVASELLEASQPLQNAYQRSSQFELTLIHPKSLKPLTTLRSALRLLPRLVANAWKNQVHLRLRRTTPARGGQRSSEGMHR